MVSRDVRRRLAPLAMFILPLVAVRVAAWYFSLTPEAAAQHDFGDAAPVVATGSKPAKPTGAERSARVHVEALESMPFTGSPMFYLPRAATAAADVDREQLGRLEVTVTLIIESRRGATALINGTPYRIGDAMPGTEWSITAIDGARRTVEFRHGRTGDIRTARVPAPRAKAAAREN